MRQSQHNLTLKLCSGTSRLTDAMLQICRNSKRAALNEAKLARKSDTGQALREYPRIAKFIEWVSGKPPTFHS